MIIIILKNLIKKIIYNKLTYFFSSDYIIYQNINKNFLYKKKIVYKQNGYLYFLYKKLREYKIKDRLLKKAFISSYTIIHELSSDCCINLIAIDIDTNIKSLNLKSLIPIYKNTLPQGICLRIKQGNKYRKVLFNKKPILGFHKIYFCANDNFYSNKNTHSYFIINFNLKKFTIVNIKKFILSKERREWKYFVKENSKYEKIKNKFINKVNINSLKKIGSLYKNIKTFSPKSELMINKYNYLDNDNNIRNKKKNYLIKRNETISEITDANISFHGLISTNGFLIEESVKNSIWDNHFIKNNENLFLPNITRTIDSTCLIFPTASNHLSHYVSESLIRLSYVKDLKIIKIIVYDKIASYLVKTITAYGIKRNQIIKKPTFETWKVKKLIFPSINWFEISKKESIYLSDKIIRKKNYKNNNFKKIYISRTDAKENRNLINEKEIENYLSKKGFKIIIASKLSLYQKINIIENAEIIITTLGSALYNFLFCKNIKAKVVLIGTKRFLIRDFLQLSYLKSIQLFFLKATEIPSYSKQWQYQVSSFFIEIKKLKILLTRLDKFS
jgi:hypothetical protein